MLLIKRRRLHFYQEDVRLYFHGTCKRKIDINCKMLEALYIRSLSLQCEF